jgi:hypothetical protein
MSNFFKFITSNRSDVGLVDRFDLSEIYASDQRYALSNLSLNPDGLDQIFGLSSDGLTKEDIRTMGGLDRPLIHSLGIADWTLSAVQFDQSLSVAVDKAIGEPEKHSFNNSDSSDNVIVFHGGIAAKKIEYKFLDENGIVRTTTVPTSRESLFNSVKGSDGNYTEASYPGLFRVRRRSHVYQINLASKLLIPKGVVVESPTDTLNIPVYMRTNANTSPVVQALRCYATKNSPIILPVNIFDKATISFSRDAPGSNSEGFIYGWELRRRSDLTLVEERTVNSSGGVTEVSIFISTAGTIGNGTDCLLYVYLNPAVVTAVNISGIGLTELPGARDIGLVGFNALRELNISGNRVTTLPVWLKTLHKTLQKLNINGNAFWNNGLVSVFDYQDMSGSGISGANTSRPMPNRTLSQVLGYSGWADDGQITDYDGSFGTVQDKVGREYKNVRKDGLANQPIATIDEVNGFRPFSALKELNIGSSAYIINGNFYELFPSLTSLVLDRDDRAEKNLIGLLPRLKNNKANMSITAKKQTEASGSIKYIGSTPDWSTLLSDSDKQQFIGQFQFISFIFTEAENLSGGIATEASDVIAAKYHHITTGTVVDAWSGWLLAAQTIAIRDTDIALKLAKNSALRWEALRSVDTTWVGRRGTVRDKVIYNGGVSAGVLQSTDVINARALATIDAFYAGWYGKIFSIEMAKEIRTMNLGANNWSPYTDSAAQEFILPTNFAATDGTSKLQNLYLHSILNSINLNLEFREEDLKNLPKLSVFYLSESYFVGKFPQIYNNSLTAGVRFTAFIRNCRFRDLNALGSNRSTRVESIYASGQGTGVGGCLLPSFVSSSNRTLKYVSFDFTLSSTYPGNWIVETLRGKSIGSLVTATPESNLPTPTWRSRDNNNSANATSDKLYHSGGLTLNSQIMVGDVVSGEGIPTGLRVTQLDRNNLFIYVSDRITIDGVQLTFTRAGQDISAYFNGHIALEEVYMNNCRAVGSMPSFVGCTKIRNLDLSNNLITRYQGGTFENLTGVSISTAASPSLRVVNLQNNAFSVDAIRRIIGELHKVAVYFDREGIGTNIRVNLLRTKFNGATNNHENYIKEDIFTNRSTSTNSSGEVITSPDDVEIKFNQLGSGRRYPGINISLFTS